MMQAWSGINAIPVSPMAAKEANVERMTFLQKRVQHGRYAISPRNLPDRAYHPRVLRPVSLTFPLALPLAALFLSGCATQTTPVRCARDVGAVAHVLDDFHDAATRAQESRYFDHFSEKGVFLGTDETERWTKDAFRAYAHPHFEKGKAWSFRAKRRDVAFNPSGDVAYFDEDLATEKLGPARGSGVLTCEQEWKILQYNLAITIPNERFDEARRAIDATPLVTDEKGASLAFMSGSWVATTEGGHWQEHWSAPTATTLIGMGMFVKESATAHFEYMEIDLVKPIPTMRVMPSGQQQIVYTLAQFGDHYAVFENGAHDFPKRIEYRREGELLVVRLEGRHADASPKTELLSFAPAITRTR
jgi:hypothetical protein